MWKSNLKIAVIVASAFVLLVQVKVIGEEKETRAVSLPEKSEEIVPESGTEHESIAWCLDSESEEDVIIESMVD